MTTIHLTDTLTEEMVRNESLLLYGFPPAEVEARDYRRLDALISTLRAVGKAARGKMLILFPYDDDPRELYDIPEVNSFIAEIMTRCPHFFYFVAPDVEAIRPLALCLCGAYVMAVDSRNQNARVGIRDIAAAGTKLRGILAEAKDYARALRDTQRMADLESAMRNVGILF